MWCIIVRRAVAMVAVKQLVLLKFGQSHGLRQAHQLQSLHLTTKFRGEA